AQNLHPMPPRRAVRFAASTHRARCGPVREAFDLLEREPYSERAMIDFYTAGTPNGQKVAIALEELDLTYRVHPLTHTKCNQNKHEYLASNSNRIIPAIIDRDEEDFIVGESNEIVIYNAEKTDHLLPKAPKTCTTVNQYLMFLMAGIGPMMGQAS